MSGSTPRDDDWLDVPEFLRRWNTENAGPKVPGKVEVRWIVDPPGRPDGECVYHRTEDGARQRAMDLAQANPGTTYSVYKKVGAYLAPRVAPPVGYLEVADDPN